MIISISGYEGFDAAEFVLDVATLASGVKSISNIGKNLPGKIPIRYLSLSGIDINLPVLCLDAATSIASAGEISSIAASGLVLCKMTSNSGSGGNSNSSSDKNIDASDTKGAGNANGIPYGFKNAEQLEKCVSELEAALKDSGLDIKSIKVRGSSVTGISSKGTGFRLEGQMKDGKWLKPSDIDISVELNDPIKGINASKNQPGFYHPDKMMRNFEELRKWSEKWSNILGREITPGGWMPGMLKDSDTITLR